MSHRDRIQNIIANSVDSQQDWQKEHYLFGKLFYVQEPFVGGIDVQNVIDELEQKIPSDLFNEIDTIMVGSFDFLEERELEAVYRDGAIYITNSLFSDDDLLENIIHETAHSIEESHGYFIYADHRVINEFVGKRKTLKRILDSHDYDTEGYDFRESEYNEEFDEFLHKNVGYSKLLPLTNGLVSNPYALTSLREYWASGFENYFLGNREEIKRLSPQLFNKIEGVITYDD
tara:strand:+ start:824 stop:1516 length:693 start_codon:yes stop_codon:yes gene_type:complete